jgi:hypothetical protein
MTILDYFPASPGPRPDIIVLVHGASGEPIQFTIKWEAFCAELQRRGLIYRYLESGRILMEPYPEYLPETGPFLPIRDISFQEWWKEVSGRDIESVIIHLLN